MSQVPKALVLVVGAGASKEVDLPVGNQLRHIIADALNIEFEGDLRSGNEVIFGALHQLAKQKGIPLARFIETCRRICDAMPQAASIDNYIHTHRSDGMVELCGKLAIARCILDAESKSSLRSESGYSAALPNFKKLELTWYNHFFRLLIEDCEFCELPVRFSKVAIISFNYDRCIEYYLHAALRNYYNIHFQQATEALSHLSIFHPYGWLGPLPWGVKEGASEFGATPNPYQLIAISQQLKTFTEGTDEAHSDIVELRTTLRESQRIAFLGFGFNKQNMQLLLGGANGKVIPSPRIYGTAMGLSESDALSIKHELGHALTGGYFDAVQLRDMSCMGLFHEFSRGLSIHR